MKNKKEPEKEVGRNGITRATHNETDQAVKNIHPPKLKVKVGEAARYLKLLDPKENNWTFQTFTDNKDKESGPDPLARILHGSFAKVKDQLVELNGQGAGVFVMVNKGDGKGRKKGNVVGVRCVWQEADRADAPSLPAGLTGIEVETSPGKHHRYVLVDGVADVQNFPGVEARLVADYGSDPSAVDVCRVLRVPGFLHKKDPASPWLVRMTESTGKRHPWEVIAGVLPPLKVSGGSVGGGGVGGGVGSVGGDGVLTRPALVHSALQCIDPDASYDRWLKVGMALHHACSGSEGLDMWDRWSSKGALYSEGVCAARWQTFGSYQGGKGATLKSLYALASKGGWGWNYYIGPENIPGTDTVVVQGCEEDAKLIALERSRVMAKFRAEHGHLNLDGKDLVITGSLDGTRSENQSFQFSPLPTVQSWERTNLLPYADRSMNGMSYKISVRPVFKAWLNYAGRSKFEGVTFKPIAGLVARKGMYRELPGATGGKLNLYRGLAIEPSRDWQGAGLYTILGHIREVLCSGHEDTYDYFIRWLAALFQRPEEVGQVVPVFQSVEGTGKNIIMDVIVAAFGQHGTTITRLNDLVGNFNSHLGRAVFVHLNEVVWGGDKQMEGVLKALITDKTMRCEAKYLPSFDVDNHIHLIISSNAGWVAPVGLTDRRYLFMKVSSRRVGNFAYFQDLAEAIENGGAEEFIGYLLHGIDLAGWKSCEMPQSAAINKAHNKARTLDPVEKWLKEVIDTGTFPGEEWVFEAGTPNILGVDLDSPDDKYRTVSKANLWKSYQSWTKGMKLRTCVDNGEFFKKLRKLSSYRDYRPRISSKKLAGRHAVFPLQLDMIRDFERSTRSTLYWGFLDGGLNDYEIKQIL